MNSLLTQSNKYNLTLTTSNIQFHSNHFSQNHRSDKRLQNMRNKQLLTSTELFKSNKPKPIMFSNKQNAISYSSSVKNTEESIKDINGNNNCNMCYNNKKAFLKKQNRLKTSICESQKQLDTGLHLNKLVNNNNSVGKKIKQVSIDLQHKYNRIFHKKTFTKKKKKESCELYFSNNNNNTFKNNNINQNDFQYVSPMPYEVAVVKSQECFASTNSSLKKQNSNYGSLVKRSLSKPILNINHNKDNLLHKNKKESNKKFQFKPRSNTYYIKSTNYINNMNNNTNNYNKLDNKTETNTNTNTTTAPQSQVFSSISTLQTLFKISELEPKQLTSHEQIKELEELNHKLNLINPNNSNKNCIEHNKINHNNNNNIITSHQLLDTSHNTKCNIINAEMLENSNINPKTNIVNEDVFISSNNRLQTYKLLLDCISKKFSEIQDIVHNDINNKIIYGNGITENKSVNKMSELHSKIEFTQDNIPKQIHKQSPLINPYDIDDDEMEEKTNMIIPQGGHSKTEPNDVYHRNNDDIINYNSFLQYKDNNQMMEPTISMNSELVKTFLELNYEGGGCNGGGNYYNNNENIVSFLSNYQNEIKSFLQPSTTLNNKSSFINNNNHNNNNTSEMSDVIINNTNDTMTTIVQSGHNTFNKLESPHFKNNNNGIHIQTHCDKVNEDEDNKCLIY